MPVEITCQQCETGNPLGRVFCMKCGAKLDSSAVSQQSMQKQQRPVRAARWGRRLTVVGLVLLSLAVVGLALWPRSIPAEAGTRRAGDATTRKLELIERQMTTGGLRLVKQHFTEKDVNGYYVFHTKSRNVLFHAAFHDGRFSAQAVTQIGPLKLGGMHTPSLRVTRTVRGVAQGDSLRVTSGAIGHLPLPGPLRGLAARKVRGAALAACPHTKVLQRVQEVSFRDDAVDLTFGLAEP